ncbi:MAG: glucosamine-6-phosphate deaminase [Chitinophagaceae bacterium]|jgi:glucosamine-6-phosphate isomerase|nr:glucosamine-6-phosphate deaminase [Chitinophagaceae bacterium]
METKIYPDYETLSAAVAQIMFDTIQQKPTAVICLASGHTPLLPCQLFVKKANDEHLHISEATFLGLDEWVGVPPENEGSCHYFLYNTVFNPLGLQAGQIHLFNSMADDLSIECITMDEVIENNGGIDLMIVGIGMNGHIGFNEPEVSFTNLSHVIELDKTTIEVGQKYFPAATTLSKGITIGLQHLMNTKQVLLIANGEKKATIIQQTIESEVSNQIPATIMQTHKHGVIMLDDAASSKINKIN